VGALYRNLNMATTTGQITITDLNDGYTLVISGGNRAFSYASTGTNPTPSTSGTFAYTLYRGGISITPTTFSWTATGVLSGTSSTGTFQPTLSNNYNIATPSTVTLQVTHEGNTITATQPVLVSQAPSNAVINTIYVSAPAIYKSAANAATAGTYTSVTIQGKKYDGSTTSNFGWITVTPNNGTESARTDTASTPLTLSPASNSGVSSYVIKLYGTATGGTAITSQTIGVTFNGADGNPATLYEISLSASVLVRNYDNTLTPSGITVSAYSTLNTTKSAYSGRFKIYEDGLVKYESTSNQSSYTYTPTTSSIGILKFELYTPGGALLDAQEAPVAVAGSSSMTFSITNSTFPIPADNSGAVVSYTGSGTNIQVLEGDQLFTYASLGTSTVALSNISRNSSNVATVTTAAAHGLSTGSLVSVNCTSNSSFNTVNTAVSVINTTTFSYASTGPQLTNTSGSGTVYLNNTTLTISSGSRNSSNVATITTSGNHGLTTGELVNITCSNSAFNATNVSVTVTNATTFTYSSTGIAIANAALTGSVYVNKNIVSIISASRNTLNVATITTSAAHALVTGDLVNITCSNSAFNATNVPVTVTDATNFTYSSTGTIITSGPLTGIVFKHIAKKRFTIGTPTLSVSNALTLGTISGVGSNTAVVAQHTNMSNSVDSVVISYPITYIRANGAMGTQTVTQAITKVKAGTLGIRGSRQLYSTDAAYVSGYDFDGGGAIASGAASYAAKATALIAAATAGSNPTTPINGDTVTFTNGTNYVYTITHNGTTWVPPGTVIDGSLLVTGSVTTSAIAAGTINVGLNITSTDGLFKIDFANKIISISV